MRILSIYTSAILSIGFIFTNVYSHDGYTNSDGERTYLNDDRYSNQFNNSDNNQNYQPDNNEITKRDIYSPNAWRGREYYNQRRGGYYGSDSYDQGYQTPSYPDNYNPNNESNLPREDRRSYRIKEPGDGFPRYPGPKGPPKGRLTIQYNQPNQQQNNQIAQNQVARPQNSSADLANQVKMSLERDGGKYRDIDVKTNGGTVIISGVVDTDQERKDVELRVLRVDGVTRLENQIQLRGGQY